LPKSPRDEGEPLVSIVIPNWNGEKLLPVCLDSLRQQTYASIETIVVDNASTDGSLALLERDYPEVRVIALEENRGYAGGVNAGFRAAGGEVLVAYNNDTEADPRWVEELVAALDRHPQAGMASSRVRLFDQRDHLHTAGDFYGLDGIPGNRGVWQPDGPAYDEETWVFGAAGVASAYRRTMLHEIGLLDESFGSYLEDVDLSWRAQLAGFGCVYAPKAIVYHMVSATGGGPTASFFVGRNTILVIVKDYPWSLLRRYWPAVARAQLRISLEALRAWRGEAARARLRGQLAALGHLPRALRQRRAVQRTRRVTDEYLLSLLRPPACTCPEMTWTST
jgi:GT2 family glycosyltransferase